MTDTLAKLDGLVPERLAPETSYVYRVIDRRHSIDSAPSSTVTQETDATPEPSGACPAATMLLAL